jgi:signal transduction histidine kinase
MTSQDRACPANAGTSLARVGGVPPFEDLDSRDDAAWRTQRDRFFVAEARKSSVIMIGLGGLVQCLLLALLWLADYPTWRICAVALMYVGFGIAHRVIIRVNHDPARTATSFILMNITSQLFIVGMATLTGGVHSPLMPSTALPAIISLLFFGPMAVSRWMALGNGLLVIAMLALPGDVTGPALPTAHYTASIMLVIAWNLMVLHLMVGKLSQIAARTGESISCLREERLSDAEARLHRLQSVGAKVAHELKNPLASIKGLCQLVARTPESERTQERLAVVASEISRMEMILGEYLSFSRPLEDIKPEAIALPALARDVLDVLDGRAQQAGVALSLEGTATAVQGDPRRLKEALINLVANAIEATPSGGSVALRIRDGEQSAILEVRDTGRGIKPEELHRLGTSFYTTRPDGTGLGVVLAQGVITQHGGSLAYVSSPGKGTTATITLPFSTLVPAGAGSEPKPATAEPPILHEARA